MLSSHSSWLVGHRSCLQSFHLTISPFFVDLAFYGYTITGRGDAMTVATGLALVATALELAVGSRLSARPEPLDLHPVAVLPFHAYLSIATGDADHDSLAELYLVRDRAAYILEHQGDFRFDTTLLLSQGVHWTYAWDLHDPDRDGRTDLIAHTYAGLDGKALLLLESPDELSFPDSVVWADSILNMLGALHPAVADLDSDSLLEIVCRDEGAGTMRIHENRGDNDYQLVAALPRVEPAKSVLVPCVTHDLDLDGYPELVWGDNKGWLTFYEAVGNDTFVSVGICSLVPTNLHWQARTVSSTRDMDGDGRAELLVLVVSSESRGRLFMLESPADDSFEVVWSTEYDASYWSVQDADVGDVDGDGVEELVIVGSLSDRIYKAVADDSLELLWLATGPYRSPVAVYDLDGDGKAEVICRSGEDETTVLSTTPAGIAEQERRRLEGVVLLPSVVHRGVAARLSDLRHGETVLLLDVSGRTVRSVTESTIRTAGLAPGAYFVRISSGNQSVVRKLLVIP